MSNHRQGNRPKYKKGQPPKVSGQATTAPTPDLAPQVPKPTSAASSGPSPVLTLDPLAPIVCRSGRPFDDQAGPDTARFPPPSTVAGCVRTAWARETGTPFGLDLMKIAVAGPLLARPDGRDGLCLYVPKPADALYFGSGDQAECVRAIPANFDPGCGADLPDGLLPVQLTEKRDDKQGPGPLWWAWSDLLDFRRDQRLSHARLTKGGWSPPTGERSDRRTHVTIDRTTQAAESGQLFQTEGLDFSPPGGIEADPDSGLRLLVRCAQPLSSALAHLGGERRMAAVCPQSETHWPSPPDDWFDLIGEAGGLTLTLLTPGLFGGGYRPGWLKEQLEGSPPEAPGVRLRLRAAALGRWQPHSGWSLAPQPQHQSKPQAQQPRAGRKLVPAGATYWLQIVGQPAREDLVRLWLAPLCDYPQDRLDGFGLALPAAWTPPTDLSETHIHD
jgi:CRISPR-associated protein Cmr3